MECQASGNRFHIKFSSSFSSLPMQPMSAEYWMFIFYLDKQAELKKQAYVRSVLEHVCLH